MTRESAKQKARKCYITYMGRSVYTYTIKDNPYYRKHKMHVKWHNEFYDECKIIGRPIL